MKYISYLNFYLIKYNTLVKGFILHLNDFIEAFLQIIQKKWILFGKNKTHNRYRVKNLYLTKPTALLKIKKLKC